MCSSVCVKTDQSSLFHSVWKHNFVRRLEPGLGFYLKYVKAFLQPSSLVPGGGVHGFWMDGPIWDILWKWYPCLENLTAKTHPYGRHLPVPTICYVPRPGIPSSLYNLYSWWLWLCFYSIFNTFEIVDEAGATFWYRATGKQGFLISMTQLEVLVKICQLWKLRFILLQKHHAKMVCIK